MYAELSLEELVQGVQTCQEKLTRGQSESHPSDVNIPEQFSPLRRSKILLGEALDMAFQKGLCDQASTFLKFGWDDNQLAGKLSMWLPCTHDGRRMIKGGWRLLNDRQEQIALQAFTVLLAQSGGHDRLSALVLPSDVCAVQPSRLVDVVPCTLCSRARRRLAVEHHHVLQKFLKMAYPLALSHGHPLTGAHILILLAGQSQDGLTSEVDWNNMELEDNASDFLLRAFEDHADHFRPTRLGMTTNVQLPRIPDVVMHMEHLRSLNISYTSVAMPAQLFDLPRLAELIAEYCGLTAWPDIRAIQPSLTSLDVSNNHLSSLHSAFERSHLRTLNMAGNMLRAIPDVVFSIAPLEELDVSDNQGISCIPYTFLRLENLRKFTIDEFNSLPDYVGRSVVSIRRTLKRKLDLTCSVPLTKLAKVALFGSSSRVRSPLRAKIQAVPELQEATVLDVKDDQEFQHFKKTFIGECHLYAVHIEGGMDLAKSAYTVQETMKKYMAVLGNHSIDGVTADVLFIVTAASRPPHTTIQPPPNSIVHVTSLRALGDTTADRTWLADMARWVSPIASKQKLVKASLFEICKNLRRWRRSCRNHSFFSLDEFLEKVEDKDAFQMAMMSPSQADEWLKELEAFLLSTGDGIILRDCSPLNPVVIFTDLQSVLSALRAITTSSPKPRSSTSTLITRASQTLNCLRSQMDEALASLWTALEEGGLAFRLDGNTAFLPYMATNFVPPAVGRFVGEYHANKVHRYISLKFASPPNESDFNRMIKRYQATLVQLWLRESRERKQPRLLAGPTRSLWEVWQGGLALTNFDGSYCICVQINNPDLAFSDSSQQRRAPRVFSGKSLMVTVAREWLRWLGKLTDCLVQHCSELLSQATVDIHVPCSECMMKPSGLTEIRHCRSAESLLEAGRVNQAVSICSEHLQEMLTTDHIADLQLCDFDPPFLTCTDDDLERSSQRARSASLPSLSLTSSCEVRLTPVSPLLHGLDIGQTLRSDSPFHRSTSSDSLSTVANESSVISRRQFLKKGGELSPVAVKTYRSLTSGPDEALMAMIRRARTELVVYSRMRTNRFILQEVRIMISQRHQISLVMQRKGLPLSDFFRTTSDNEDHTDVQVLHKRWHKICTQLAGCVADMHRKGLLHRDIKPGNILLSSLRDNEAAPSLIDFDVTTLLTIGSLCQPQGTEWYLAPEIVDGRPYSLPSDVYSFGFLLYEVVANRKTQPDKGHPRRRLRQIQVKARNNRLGLVALAHAAERCTNAEPLLRPPLGEVARFLHTPAAHFLLKSLVLDETVEPASLQVSLLPAGLQRQHLIALSRRGDELKSSLGVQTLPFHPNGYLKETIMDIEQTGDACPPYCITDDGVLATANGNTVHFYTDVGKVFPAERRTAFQQEHTVTSMVSHRNLVFVGLENGTIACFDCDAIPTKVRPAGKFTTQMGRAVKKIIAVREKKRLGLWCLCQHSDQQIHLIVCKIDRTMEGEVELTGRRDLTQSEDWSIQDVMQSSREALVWGALGSCLMAWNYKSLSAVAAPRSVREDLAAEGGRCLPMLDRAAFDSDLLITCMCAVNNVLWVGTSLGFILLYSDTASMRLLSIISAHCDKVCRLLIMRSSAVGMGDDLGDTRTEGQQEDNDSESSDSGEEVSSVRLDKDQVDTGQVGEQPDAMDSSLVVLSVGRDCALECPSQAIALRSSANVWRDEHGIDRQGVISDRSIEVDAERMGFVWYDANRLKSEPVPFQRPQAAVEPGRFSSSFPSMRAPQEQQPTETATSAPRLLPPCMDKHSVVLVWQAVSPLEIESVVKEERLFRQQSDSA